MSESSGEQVPLWYVSFADMITLLLAFFVMLQSMAPTKEPTLFCTSMQSFRRAISRMGLPDWLFERDQPPHFNYKQLKYPDEPTEEMTQPLNRSNDPQDDKIRAAFDAMQKNMSIESQNVPDKKVNSYPQIINFTSPDQEPDAAGRAKLSELARDLRSARSVGKIEIRIIGLAYEQSGEQEKLSVSSKRAMQTERIFRKAIQTGNLGAFRITAWGAGDGKSLGKKFGQLDAQITVIVAVLEG